MDLCCIMMLLGCILSGLSIWLILLALFYLYCPSHDSLGYPTNICPATFIYDVLLTNSDPAINSVGINPALQSIHSALQALCAFHIMALLWCITTCVLFGVGLCAPRCREDNKAFMVGLIICCGLWSACDMIATALCGYYVFPHPYHGSCHGDLECINYSITFAFLLVALLLSAACCAFAGVACCVKDKSKEARLEAENAKPRRRREPPRQRRELSPARRERSPRRRERSPRRRERKPTYYYYDDDYYYY